MENSGQISVIPKSDLRPLQPSDMKITPPPTFIPIPIIMNGQILDHNLKFLSKDRKWLDKQLKKQHYKDINEISDITLALYNQEGTLDIDTDNPNDTNKKKNLLTICLATKISNPHFNLYEGFRKFHFKKPNFSALKLRKLDFYR